MAEPQRWNTHPKARAWAGIAVATGVLMLGAGVFAVASGLETRNDTILAVLFLLQSVLFFTQGWTWRRSHVEATDDGVVVANGGRPHVIAWDDIAELRPSTPRSWATNLVVIRRDGERVDLPLPADHRGLLDRWDAQASLRSSPQARRGDPMSEGRPNLGTDGDAFGEGAPG